LPDATLGGQASPATKAIIFYPVGVTACLSQKPVGVMVCLTQKPVGVMACRTPLQAGKPRLLQKQLFLSCRRHGLPDATSGGQATPATKAIICIL